MARGGDARGTDRSETTAPTDWVTRAADDAIRHAGGEEAVRAEGRTITCASGASPSGPVHLGNLREFLTVHFVAEEIRRRDLPVRHLHSWDDYDRRLFYLWTNDGEFINLSLVEGGFAEAIRVAPNDLHYETLLAAERDAALAGLGMWGECSSR